MLLQDSRREARVNEQGELVTLEEQDRSRWDAAEIEEGVNLVQKALRLRRVGNYQLQAAIAAVHAEAKTADRNGLATDRRALRRADADYIVADRGVESRSGRRDVGRV